MESLAKYWCSWTQNENAMKCHSKLALNAKEGKKLFGWIEVERREGLLFYPCHICEQNVIFMAGAVNLS